MKKFLEELESIKGRHTELISLYIPKGYNLQEILNMLKQEVALTQNVKSRTTRKNVLDALEKIINHLRQFRETPPNGLVVFAGNVSQVEGQTDIKLWSIEPIEELKVKLYWCDQKFVLDPLKEMVKEKEIYGLIVLDSSGSDIGLLIGKRIVLEKHLDSLVPGKTSKGGWCISEESYVVLKEGIEKLGGIKEQGSILAYDFRNNKVVHARIDGIKRRLPQRAYKIITENPVIRLEATPEHVFFIFSKNGIETKTAEELKKGDVLLALSKISYKGKGQMIGGKKSSVRLCQLLGYLFGNGYLDRERMVFYGKKKSVLEKYAKLVEEEFGTKAVIKKGKDCYEMEVCCARIVDGLKKDLPDMDRRGKRDVPKMLLSLPERETASFLRGLFDATGYVSSREVCASMLNEEVAKALQILLLRFGILSSIVARRFGGLEKFALRIADSVSIFNFGKHVNFSCLEKRLKLSRLVKRISSSPYKGFDSIFHGNQLSTSKSFASMMIEGRENRYMGVSSKGVVSFGFERNVSMDEDDAFAHGLQKYGLIGVKVSKKIAIKPKNCYYDVSVPRYNNFIVNGIIVHNSQQRYARIREEAKLEHLKKTGEEASKIFLQYPTLKGILIGGPGPLKEKFYEGEFLNYQLQKKVLGVVDTSYLGQQGLEELVERGQDLIKEAALVKERQLLQKFFVHLQKEDGLAVYKIEEVVKAIEAGAVDVLLVSEVFNWKKFKLSCQCGFKAEKAGKSGDVFKCPNCGSMLMVQEQEDLAELLAERVKEMGGGVEIISKDSREGSALKEIGGIGAILRYRIN